MTRNKILGGIGGIVVLAVIAIVALFALRDDAPDEFELRTADDLVEEEAAEDEAEESAPEEDAPEEDTSEEAASDEGSADESSDTDDAVLGDVEGQWLVGPESAAGYRVVEDFAGGIQDFEAVGRTNMIEGFLNIEGTTVTTATFDVDIASITSDSDQRDGQFRGRIMNAAEFPTAKFVLTSPIELGEIPGEASPISTSASGDLTLRGSTQPVEVTIDAQIVNGEIEVVGSIDVLFSDYGIDNPSFPAVTVRDEGLVEFQLIFIR